MQEIQSCLIHYTISFANIECRSAAKQAVKQITSEYLVKMTVLSLQ